jgi:nicotinamide-nucleotide amidase
VDADAARLVAAARAAGSTLAVAESLTAGMVAAAIGTVPGASDVFLGGIVAYDATVKESVLGVDRSLLARCGPVSSEVAIAMAEGAARIVGADTAVATTGVAGPDAHGGRPPGTVYIAVVAPGEVSVEELEIAGNRADIRGGATRAALSAAIAVLERRGARR